MLDDVGCTPGRHVVPVVAQEEDGERRKKLEDVLTRGADFTAKAQTNRGGWGYVSAKDGGGFDEGSTTITQLQALRAARNAGIAVPREIIEKAQKGDWAGAEKQAYELRESKPLLH